MFEGFFLHLNNKINPHEKTIEKVKRLMLISLGT